MSTSTGALQPVGRVHGLDVLRGLAIFGILVVNLEQMFLPLALADKPVGVFADERGARIAWLLTDALFRDKFLAIFSLLFGAGFCLQFLRAGGDRTAFRQLYLRRLAMLAVFGAVHAVFFYMADVLIVYALTALAMFPWKRRSPRVLCLAGSLLLAAMTAWYVKPGAPEDPTEAERIQKALAHIRSTGQVRLSGEVYPLPLAASNAMLLLRSDDPVERAEAEYAVFSLGPVAAAIFSRLSFLAFLLGLYTPLYLLWRTLGLFLLAAGLVKWGILHASRRQLWRRVARTGFIAGVPATLVASWLRLRAYHSPGPYDWIADAVHELSALLLAAAIGAAILLWSGNGLTGRLQTALAAVGRTALTNYLGQSVVMSVVATSYGLGLYGDLTRMQLGGLAVVCFAAQLLVSSWWMRHFRIGPLEWLWRSLTYWRRMPLRRTGR